MFGEATQRCIDADFPIHEQRAIRLRARGQDPGFQKIITSSVQIMAPTAEEELYLTPMKTPICLLDAKEAFEGLSGHPSAPSV